MRVPPVGLAHSSNGPMRPREEVGARAVLAPPRCSSSSTGSSSTPSSCHGASDARTLETHADGKTARIDIDFHGVTRALHDRQRQPAAGIDRHHAADGPFRHLHGEWRFVALASTACKSNSSSRTNSRPTLLETARWAPSSVISRTRSSTPSFDAPNRVYAQRMNVTVVWATSCVQDIVDVDAARRARRSPTRSRNPDSSRPTARSRRDSDSPCYGRRAAAEAALADGDRVELTRPLDVDPKVARDAEPAQATGQSRASDRDSAPIGLAFARSRPNRGQCRPMRPACLGATSRCFVAAARRRRLSPIRVIDARARSRRAFSPSAPPPSGMPRVERVDARRRVSSTSALDLIGIRYKWGGKTPATGLDCSGLVRYVFQQVTGVTLPRTAKDMSRIGEQVALPDLKPGDLVFFNTRRLRVLACRHLPRRQPFRPRAAARTRSRGRDDRLDASGKSASTARGG